MNSAFDEMRKNKANVLSTLCENLKITEASTSAKEFTNKAIERPKQQNDNSNHNLFPISSATLQQLNLRNSSISDSNNMHSMQSYSPLNDQFTVTANRRALVKKNH